jgi:hypothetical protein
VFEKPNWCDFVPFRARVYGEGKGKRLFVHDSGVGGMELWKKKSVVLRQKNRPLNLREVNKAERDFFSVL